MIDKIDNFLGINKKSDPLDTDKHECQTLDGFDVAQKPGALVKRKGYTDQADVSLPASYPSSWTIVNFFRFVVNKPSAQVVTVVHATVGGENRVYVDYTVSSGSWVQAWVELTENEEDIAATTSTDGDNLYSTNLGSSANDYYNGWYVFNWARRLGSLVSDFTGATQKLALQTSVTNQVSGDKFSIYRYPLVTNQEGAYTSDTGATTTQTIDLEDFSSEHYELRSDFDDAYKDWVIHISGLTRTDVVSYDATYTGNKRRLTHSAITGATDGASYWLYNRTRVLTVDDKIHFHQRPDTCIMATGSASGRYPKQYPLWYGYIRNNYYFGSTTSSVNEGYHLEPSTLDAPDDSIISSFAETAGGPGGTDPVDAATYYIVCAYKYDGYQYGALTSGMKAEATKTVADGTNNLSLTLQIGFSAASNMAHSKTLNKRVTGIGVFMSDDYDITQGTGAWYRIIDIPIRGDFDIGVEGTRPAPTHAYERRSHQEYGSTGMRQDAVITEGGRTRQRKGLENKKFEWTGTDPYSYTMIIYDATWDKRGFTYSWVSGGLGGDRINFAVVDEHQNHTIVGDVFSERQERAVMAYTSINVDGAVCPDYFPTLNVLNNAKNNVYTVRDVKVIRDNVYVIGDSKSLRMNIRSGGQPSFRVNAEFPYVGTSAKFGSLKWKNGVFVAGKRGVFYLDNVSNYISAAIEDITSFPLGVTDLSEAYMGFNGETHELVIAFPTDSKLYIFNTLVKQWKIDSVADAIKAMVTGSDGELFIADGSKIYRAHNGTTDDSTAIAPEWKSKVYNHGHATKDKIIKEFEIVYKSNTAIQFDVYLDRSASVYSWNISGDNQLAAATTITSARLQAPVGLAGKEFEYKISIPAANQAANTYVEVYSVNVSYDTEEQ